MKKKYKQGVYNPIHKEKCISNLCIYRSSLELKFMKWCDSNSNVLKWGSENIIIPYLNPFDKKIHRYFVDNYVVLKDKQNNIHKYIVEIKPYSQTQPPKTSKRKNPRTLLKEQYIYAINTTKHSTARQWAEKRNYKFIIITEKDLKNTK